MTFKKTLLINIIITLTALTLLVNTPASAIP